MIYSNPLFNNFVVTISNATVFLSMRFKIKNIIRTYNYYVTVFCVFFKINLQLFAYNLYKRTVFGENSMYKI